MNLSRKTLETVRAFAREHALFRPGPLLVAVSGGTDSTALLLILRDLVDEHGLILHVAHFDHRARPRASAADAQYVADLAARCGAPVRVGRAETKPASEDAARTQRYEFLRRAAAELGVTAIATGHTRDDQAETVLLHAVRGSGLAGIAGMRPSREGIIRPLLAIGRDETAAICAAAGIAPREDPSNRSLRFARNRVRHRVLPQLAKLNPRAGEALARLAAAAAEATDALRAIAEAAADAALAETGAAAAAHAPEGIDAGDNGGTEAAPGAYGIDLDLLGPDATIREEALALLWQRATGRTLSARSRAALAAEATRRDGSASLDLPGGRAVREYARLRISPTAAAGQPSTTPPGELPLPPGVPVAWSQWTLMLTRGGSADGWSYSAAAPEPSRGLRVRARRPGDRMAGGTAEKIQDVLTDAKIPASRRDAQPLVVTDTGEVWWIPGVTSRPVGGGWIVVARKTMRRSRSADGVASYW